MKYNTIVSTLVLASSVVAAPHSAKRATRHEARMARHVEARDVNATVSSLHSVPKIASTGPAAQAAAAAGNNSFVSYSSNWAGAVLTSTGVTSVVGTFVAPTPSSSGSGAAWVGIDGDSCETAILQTGIDWTKSGSSITYDAWYEWYPHDSYDFDDISVSAGDVIKATVTASGKTGGTAVIENTTTGESQTKTFSGESAALCKYDAEWIVEDYEEGSSLVSFADFGTVHFHEASATIGGAATGVTEASIIDIEQSSTVLTNCSIESDSEIVCSYV